MRDSKWIAGLSSTMPSVEAARKVLSARLATVAHYLPLAAHHPQDDVEYVHQLRVSTRRATAAIDIFAAFLERKIYQAARKQLRRIRRTAGNARDADVFLQKMQVELTECAESGATVLHFLVGLIWQRRIDAQGKLREVAEHAFNVSRIVNAVGEAKDYDTPRRFGRLAAVLVNALVHEFDGALASPTDDVAALHEVRIRGKQLRYAMEICSPCFAPAFREVLYPAVEDAQEILGDFNDCHNFLNFLDQCRPGLDLLPPPLREAYYHGVDLLAKKLRNRADGLRSQFSVWTQRWRELRQAMPAWLPVDDG
jgi:CHAD domain-containing protein